MNKARLDERKTIIERVKFLIRNQITKNQLMSCLYKEFPLKKLTTDGVTDD